MTQHNLGSGTRLPCPQPLTVGWQVEAKSHLTSSRPETVHEAPPVAIVHDYLNQRGGAERVVRTLADTWPDAPIYTSLFRPQSTFPEFAGRDVRTTFIDQLPVDRRFRALLPLYAPAFATMRPIDAKVVIASSSGWAHMAPVARGSLKVVYCHTPARWLYGREHLRASASARAVAAVGPLLRWVDVRAARGADLYVANSTNVQRRIWSTYGLDAAVVHPPVDTDRFEPTPRGERLLVISRLLPYKRVDLVVRAARRARIGLDVVGTGPSLAGLRQLGGSNTVFHGAASDAVVTALLQRCRAVCVPGEEDFGIVAVEAMAAGKPVIAFRGGGSLESVQEGVTGVFFDHHDETALLDAISSADALTTSPEAIAQTVRCFSADSFRSALRSVIRERLGSDLLT